jgi:mRNA-degrading endonuclease RelE of RelBE toxin-antitoxin system
MSRADKFELGFAPEVVDHLAAIERKHHRLIQKTLDEQLSHAPDAETRNRKPVERPAPVEATWELRFGPGNRFRVFYEVDDVEHVVWILAIGVKERDRLWFGGEEFKL